MNKQEKNYLKTALMCYFFGAFGVHRFINNKTESGVAMLLTCGGCGLWNIIDLIQILNGNFKNDDGEIISTNKSFFNNTANIIIIVSIVMNTYVVSFLSPWLLGLLYISL